MKLKLFSNSNNYYKKKKIIYKKDGLIDKEEDDKDFERKIKSLRKNQDIVGTSGRIVAGSLLGGAIGGGIGLHKILSPKSNISNNKAGKILTTSALIGGLAGGIGGSIKGIYNSRKNKLSEKEIIQGYKNLSINGKHKSSDNRYNYRNTYLDSEDDYLYKTLKNNKNNDNKA